MIKTKKGATKIKGSEHEIFADLTCIAKTILESLKKEMTEEEAKKKILNSIEIACMSKEEFEEKLSQALKERLKEISKLLGETDEYSDEGDANAD